MKLIKNNILFVKRHEHNGVTYSYFVAMKSRRVCDAHQFINYKDGKTTIAPYPKERLPKAVQNFLDSNTEELLVDGEEYKIYMTGTGIQI